MSRDNFTPKDTVNPDWCPVKLDMAVTCALQTISYAGPEEPLAFFLADNVFEWGLAWERDAAKERVRIPLVILITNQDEPAGPPITLSTKNSELLNLVRLEMPKLFLLVISEFVSSAGCSRVYGLVVSSVSLSPKHCSTVKDYGFLIGRRGPDDRSVQTGWLELQAECVAAN